MLTMLQMILQNYLYRLKMSNPYEQFRQAIMGGLPIDNAVSFDQFQDARLSGLLKSLQPNPQLMNDMSNVSQQINQQQVDKNLKEQKRKERRQALEDIAARFGIINAQQSGNYQQANIMQNNLLERQKARVAEQEKNKILANMSPDQRAIYNEAVVLGGPAAGFNALQSIRNAEITALQQQRQAQALKDAGIDERSIALFTNAGLPIDKAIEIFGPSENEQKIQNLMEAGLTREEALKKAGGVSDKYIFEDDKNLNITKSTEDLDKEVNEQYISSEGLQKIDQGFGLKDSIDNIANQALGPIFGTPAKDTNKAIAAKKVLNENLRERFVNQYSGRPSVYLNQRIDALLPQDVYMSEFDALQRYTEISRVLIQAKQELKQNIDSGAYEGQDLLTLQNEYKSTSILLRDLEVATGNLKGDEQANISIVSEGKNSGQFNNFYLEE